MVLAELVGWQCCQRCADKSIAAGEMDGLQLAVDVGSGDLAAVQGQLEDTQQRVLELEGLLGSSQLGAMRNLLEHCGHNR